MNKVTHLSILIFVFIAIFLVSCQENPVQKEEIEMVSNLSAQRDSNGVKLTWEYDLPATFDVYRGNKDDPEHLVTTTNKYFIDENPDPTKNHYYVKATYSGKTSKLKEIIVDLQAPQVSISSPEDGSVLSGIVTIEASAHDDTAVATVAFYTDGTKAGEDNDSPYQYSWDTSSLTNNSTHTIQAKAYDIIGNSGQSNIVAVRVVNNIPQVRIVSPTNGETLHGMVTILAEAQDNERIAQVEFFANDKLLKSFISSPYEYVWNTYGVIDGTYTLKVEATDLLGNQNFETINVIVNNGQKTFGESGDDVAECIQQTTDGGYIVAGYTTSFGAGGYDIHILKLDSNENLVWQKTFGGGLDDFAFSIQQTTDGGYIVAGYTFSFGVAGDAYVLKLNPSGELQWQKTFGGNGFDTVNSVKQTTNGGYIVAGFTNSFGAGGYDVYILKLDSDENLVWQKTFGGNGDDYAWPVKQTTDGGYIVAGYTTSFGTGNLDVYILKLNSDGSLAWQKTFGRNGDDWANSVQETTDGGYIVAGGTTPFGASGYDVYVLKLNSDGSLAWQKTFGGSDYDVAYAVQETTDGGYIVAGCTWSFGTGGSDAYILKLNSDGSLEWQKTFGGNSYDIAYSIQQTANGGYIVAGYTTSFGTGDQDIYILKLDSNGELHP